MNDVIEYLYTLPPVEMVAAIRALPPEKKHELSLFIFNELNGMTDNILEHREELWYTGDLPG